MATTVRFKGYNLTANFIVGNITRGYAVREIRKIDVSGMDGALYGSSKLSPINITMSLTYTSDSPSDRSTALRNLASVLLVSKPEELYISDDGGKFYYAVPSGGDVTRYIGAESFDLTFTALDPVMYGNINMADLPASFTVKGNYPTMPMVDLTGAVAAGDILGLSFDGEDFEIPIADAAPHAVAIRGNKRTVTVDGDPVVPTIASDWPVLDPGAHTVSVSTGTATGYVSWWDRWL